MQWIGQSTAALLNALSTGAVTATELTEQHLSRIEQTNGKIGAFLEVFSGKALQTARSVDQRRDAGEPLGVLAGIPVAIKDNLCLQGTTTSCASRMLETFSAPYDAHVIQQLQAADAVILGRTNMDEFAMGSSCESSAYQKTYNPWNTSTSPGGSSGGSAAAVAAGMVPLALGSDTGGSIRQPASFCGVVGLKPTYGRVSRYGLVAFASSLDQIGPFASDVTGAAHLLNVIAGHDSRDATSAQVPTADYTARLDEPLAGMKIGIVPEHFGDGLHSDVRESVQQTIETYRQLGAEICEVELPHARYGVAVYYVIAPSEASSNLARYDGVHYGHRETPESGKFENLVELYELSRSAGFGDEVKRRIMLGTYALSSGYYDAYYKKALQVRRLIRQDFDQAFSNVDFVLTPAAPTPAFSVGELNNDPLAMYLNDIFTIGANLAGIPGVSLPCGKSQDGRPIGVQLLAPAFEEAKLLRAARMLEQQLSWSDERTACLAALS
ncbi:MAG: Asp-tRNA(Asn)/Glu-tRNA(Gln) amidotransferase subunit GatA [Planctomycetaceae bacterium]|nr:Asp-tRNA(Asn)/Glu-tRNA(Gln) amidotransferase subunit GatA [Planctomycetaceae bacterium]